ncbi:hypothetical protein ERW51_11305 [Aliivibrio finisterrensis]|uniref:hypothetical protein n=1 Tax=Aliivibrio finisterrensis TaxID=511998 RepID=UPI00101EE0EF|nr:hypothetical protein [Aliivibrio finisterrensis]RYU67610.1 hypothetical protein ERW54_12035 [Aliivibrio finisterrensis]RYU71042.1 hypothetical protein ERW51_11305 [Aliivibrio finisterrensis]RYU74604.1 hypothetical protein ERW48_10890 [Aliivibrio finisterrensis]
MKIAHKRKVQSKLHKRIKATAPKTEVKKAAKPAKVAKPVEKKVEAVVAAAPKAVTVATDIALTPKQQTVFDIVCQNPEGINSKEIGVKAGQEETKAAAWATGGLKKLVEENLVVREQLAGNKVIYKAV